MTINAISDIHCRNKSLPTHLEFENLTPADVLVIAGDIGTFVNRDKIINKIKENYIGEDKQFKYLVYCWGNHDYYVTDKHWNKYHPNQYHGPSTADNHVDVIGDVAFICSPMWSFIFDHNMVASVMNDYVFIPTTTYQINELFLKNAQWILDMIELYKGMGKKIVVVTHHLPNPQNIDEKYRKGPDSRVNDAYAVMKESYVRAFEQAEADVWIHGHSHQHRDEVIGKTRYIRNPFGYDWTFQEWPLTNFKYDCIINI